MSTNNLVHDGGEFLLYKTEDGKIRIETRMENETVWLSINQMAELFERGRSVITKHISNVFQEAELIPNSTTAKFASVQKEGRKRILKSTSHDSYSLQFVCYNAWNAHLVGATRRAAELRSSSPMPGVQTVGIVRKTIPELNNSCG